MKIMIVTPYFYPKIGGLENYALNMAIGLKKQGHEVFVVTSNHQGRTRVEETIKGLRVIRLAPLIKLSNTPINPLWRWQLRKIIRDEKPNVINAHTPVPYISDMAVRAAQGVPTTLTYHNDLVKASGVGKYLAKLYYVLYIKNTLQKVDGIIATSNFYAERSPYIAKHLSKTSIVSPGVDIARFNDKVDKTWLRKQYPNKQIVLFVGNMDKTHSHKGLDVLIKAITNARKKVPNIQLVAVSKGDGIPDYKALAEELGIAENVDFTGFVSDKDLPRYYAGSHAFVLPSTTDAEGFGMVLIEAQASGVPVIGTKVGGVPYAMHDGETGYLVEANNVNNLGAALIKVLKKPQSFGANGVRFVSENFDWLKLSRNYSEVLEYRARPTIIQVTPYYKPHIGGMEKVVEAISLELAESKWKVEVITSDIGDRTPFTDVNSSNYSVERLRSVEIAHLPIIWRLLPRLLRAPSRSIYHVHIAQAFIPEIALLAARIKHSPFIAHFHLDVAPSGFFGFIFVIYKRTIFPFMLRRADKVIVFSDNQANLVIDKYGVKESQIAIVPNGVSKYFSYNLPRNIHKNPRLIYVGRLTSQKNLTQLFKALETVSEEFSSTIVGDGDLRTELEHQVKNLRLQNVEFVGFKSWEETLEFYRHADIFVLPSEREGMPLVLLEAMAMGLPIVATDVIGSRDVVMDDVNGILVPFGDANALRKSLLMIKSDKRLYSRLSNTSRKLSESYSWAQIAKQFEKIYGEVGHD